MANWTVPLENLEMSERTGIILLSFSSPMLSPLTALFATLSSVLRSRSVLQLENVALRHQIAVLQRAAGKRLKLRPGDRLLWVWLSRIWSGWRSALAIVKRETVVAWHRVGFRRFWTWKVRRGRLGRPVVSREVRNLVRRMCRENPSWVHPAFTVSCSSSASTSARPA
jgi:putative transposase